MEPLKTVRNFFTNTASVEPVSDFLEWKGSKGAVDQSIPNLLESNILVSGKGAIPPTPVVNSAGQLPAGILSISGKDDRLEIEEPFEYPWRMICSLNIISATSFSAIGTGWLVSPRLVITAAHCVRHSILNGWAERIEVIPGRLGGHEKFGRQTSMRFETPALWTRDGGASYDQNYDYAAIYLDAPFDPAPGYFGYRVVPEAVDHLINVTGYPSDQTAGTMWSHRDKILMTLDRKLFYTLDTFGGQSGSPAYTFLDGTDEPPVSIGIHGYGFNQDKHNSAARINEQVAQVIGRWIARSELKIVSTEPPETLGGNEPVAITSSVPEPDSESGKRRFPPQHRRLANDELEPVAGTRSVRAGDFVSSAFEDQGFSFEKALGLAALSQIAYSDEAEVALQLAAWGLDLEVYFDEKSTDTQGFIASHGDFVFLSFRGTQEMVPDWIGNLKMTLKTHDIGGKSHRGFTLGVDSVWTVIAPILTIAAAGGKRVFYTGHSLGGALATMTAAKVASTFGYELPEEVYTFGQPLVGGAVFARQFNSIYRNRFFRFRNRWDTVTRIPPKPFFKHTEDLIKFGAKGVVTDGLTPWTGIELSALEMDDVLSEAEFETLQREAMLEQDGPVTEGAFSYLSGLKFHSLGGQYLPILRRHAGREESLTESRIESGTSLPGATGGSPPEWLQEIDDFTDVGLLQEALQTASTALDQGENGAARVVDGLFDQLRHLPALLPPLIEGASLPGPAGEEDRPINSTDFAALEDEYTQMFQTMTVRADRRSTVAWYLNRLINSRGEYKEVGDPLGIPWEFIGIIHVLECNSNFDEHLHNGDPITARTIRVPRGRPAEGEPPFDWTDSATDALKMKNFHRETDWSLARMLHRLERYNGFGYRPRFVPSPYLWSFSRHYSQGKFVLDGVFDPHAVSNQVGAAVLLSAVRNNGTDLT